MSLKKHVADNGLRRTVMLSLAAGFASLALCFPVKAALGTGEITADQVNVRSDAGTAAARVCTLPRGTQMVVESVKADPAGKYWYQVSLNANGKTYQGYVLGDYVKYTAADANASASQEGKKKKKKKQKTESGETQIAVPADIVEAVAAQEQAKKSETAAADQGSSAKTASASESTNAAANAFTKGQKAVSKGDQVRVRKSPVTGEAVGYLTIGKKVKLRAVKTGSDGQTWYKVRYKENGKVVKGYVRADLLTVIPGTQKAKSDETDVSAAGAAKREVKILSDAEFEAEMTKQGFPEGYKKQLRALHKAHPTWTFKAVVTGQSWSDALAAECKIGLNLVAKGSIASWKSTQPTAFNWRTNTWYSFDGGSWVAASEDLIAYYMDPRNFLTESQIFQFESLEYEDYQDAAGVKSLLAGTFMKGQYTEPDGTQRSYADTFVEIGKQVAVNPYHLAVRCYQEQGMGTSDSISGKVVGFENIFNYFNIGAYATGKNTPTRQGLYFASTTSSGAANYYRPWNTRYQSILGGASYLAEKYVKAGQNTLYFQKFNVVNSGNGLYKHQYMANVQAAGSEAARMSKAYAGRESALVFYIPVYASMPEKVCEKPTSDLSTNDYLLSITANGEAPTPAFNGGVYTYTMTVKKKVKTAVIEAETAAATATVSGTGEFALERGENSFEIVCRSAAGTERRYNLIITRK